MARHIWSVLCSRMVVDEESHTVSLIDAMEQLTITLSPDKAEIPENTMVPVTMRLVSMFIRNDPEKPEPPETVRFEIHSPKGKTIGHAELNSILEKAIRCRLFLNIQGLPWCGEGLYHFLVRQRRGKKPKWVTVAKVPLQVTVKIGE